MTHEGVQSAPSEPVGEEVKAPRKPVPTLPNSEEDGHDKPSYNGKGALEEVTSPEPTHKQKESWFKLTNGMYLVIGLLAAILLLTIIGFCTSKDLALLTRAIEVLAMFGTTILGYLFGRGTDNS